MPIPGQRLSAFAEVWTKAGADPALQKLIKHGHKVQFDEGPLCIFLNCVRERAPIHVTPPHGLFMSPELYSKDCQWELKYKSCDLSM